MFPLPSSRLDFLTQYLELGNMADYKNSPDDFTAPLEDEQGLVLERDWTEAEERKAKRK